MRVLVFLKSGDSVGHGAALGLRAVGGSTFFFLSFTLGGLGSLNRARHPHNLRR